MAAPQSPDAEKDQTHQPQQDAQTPAVNQPAVDEPTTSGFTHIPFGYAKGLHWSPPRRVCQSDGWARATP